MCSIDQTISIKELFLQLVDILVLILTLVASSACSNLNFHEACIVKLEEVRAVELILSYFRFFDISEFLIKCAHSADENLPT